MAPAIAATELAMGSPPAPRTTVRKGRIIAAEAAKLCVMIPVRIETININSSGEYFRSGSKKDAIVSTKPVFLITPDMKRNTIVAIKGTAIIFTPSIISFWLCCRLRRAKSAVRRAQKKQTMKIGAPEDAATMRIKKGRKAFQDGIVVVLSAQEEAYCLKVR